MHVFAIKDKNCHVRPTSWNHLIYFVYLLKMYFARHHTVF